RRRRIIALLVATVGLGVALYFGFAGWGGSRSPPQTRPPAAVAGRHLSPSRLIFVGSRDNAGDAVAVVNPAERACRTYVLPDSGGVLWFTASVAGRRIAYEADSGRGNWTWAGRIGRRLRRIHTPTLGHAPPVWVG